MYNYTIIIAHMGKKIFNNLPHNLPEFPTSRFSNTPSQAEE